MHKFFGCNPAEADHVVKQQHFNQNAAAFFTDGSDSTPDRTPPGQSMDAAMNVFHGVEERKRGMSGFDPIPGYAGTNQRQEADGFFACTFKVGRE